MNNKKYIFAALFGLSAAAIGVLQAAPPAQWPYIVLTPGSAPSTLNNGTIWTTTAGLFARINGTTVGPYGTGTGTLANPTATAGPTAVNGSASTYMRSDGAPAVQKASNAQFGLVEGDGQTISITAGVASTVAANVTKTANYTIAAGDMGGQVNYNGTSITATIPAISSTVLAAGMSVTITNRNSTALTLSSTPTINGFSGTSIPQYGGMTCVSNGTSLDCVGLGVLAALTGTVTSPVPITWDSTTAVTAQTVEFPIVWTSGTITKVLTAVSGGGSFSVAIKINGTNVTSCSAISVSGTSNTVTTCTAANTVALNDQVTAEISSPSGTVNQAYVTPVITHTVN